MTFFPQTNKELKNIDSLLGAVVNAAIRSGANPESLNIHNAVQTCIKNLDNYLNYQDKVQELGYSSIGMALKALGQYKQNDNPADLNHLPEIFHKIPAIWLSGKPKTKKETGFAPLRVKDAQRQHKVLSSLLVEAWGLADDEIQDQITKEYLSSSAAEFERNLYKYINDLEEVSIEEEFEHVVDEIVSPRLEEMRALRVVESPKDYGVGGTL
jgi:hypothetical protein